MGVHEFFGVGAGIDELADAAADAAFEFGGGGKEGFFGRFYRVCLSASYFPARIRLKCSDDTPK